MAARLNAAGIGVGDRVGGRRASGTAELYVAILAVLATGAAYLPVDADDPAERADLAFGEAAVCAVLTDDGLSLTGPPIGTPGRPTPADDAWVIFTSGSTGTPKGVAVSHRAAAAFVDAEARLFVPDEPIGPGGRAAAREVCRARRAVAGRRSVAGRVAWTSDSSWEQETRPAARCGGRGRRGGGSGDWLRGPCAGSARRAG